LLPDAHPIRNAIRAISNRTPRFRKSESRIETEPVGKELVTPGQPTRYVKRTLSFLVVPLIAAALLGTDEAKHYFPPLPTTGHNAQASTATARFTFIEAVLGFQTVLSSGTIAISANDILPHHRNGTLYFSPRLQNAVLDGVSNQFPQLYMHISHWLDERFQAELHSWQQRHQPAIVAAPEAQTMAPMPAECRQAVGRHCSSGCSRCDSTAR
jgi:hypothetical protein